MDADAPEGGWCTVLPRVSNTEYDISHRGADLFILLRDEGRPNSELLVAPASDPTSTMVHLPLPAARQMPIASSLPVTACCLLHTHRLLRIACRCP